MKKIRVVDTGEQPESFISVEREIFYKELLRTHQIDDSYVDGFVEIENYLFNIKDRFTPSNLFFINIKKILSYAIPIITPKVLEKSEAKKKIESAKYNTIQLEYATFSFILDDKKLSTYVIPKGTKFEIIGFCFPQQSKFSLVPVYCTSQLPFSLDPFKFTRDIFSFITSETDKETFIRTLFSTIDIHDTYLTNHIDSVLGIQYYLIQEEVYQKNDFYVGLLNQIQSYVKFYNRCSSAWYRRYMYYAYRDKIKKYLITFETFKKYMTDAKKGYVATIQKWNDIPFIHSFNKISSVHINPYYTSSMYMVLQMLQESELYDHFVIYGESHTSVQSKMKRIHYKKQQFQIIQENNKKYVHTLLQNIHIERIAHTSFPDIFNASSKKCIFRHNQSFDIKKVPKTIRDTIMLLYDKQKTLLSQYTSNTCEHRKVLRKYHMYPSLDTFKEIKKYINVSSKKDGILTCKLCQFDLFCIHEYEYYQHLEKIKDELTTEKENILNSDIIEKYKADVPIQFTIYCKICSKELGKSIDIEQYTSFIGNKMANAYISSFDDEVNTRLVYYTKDIVTKYIDISQLNLSKKKFAYKIVNMIYPFIKSMDERLQKSATILDKQSILNIHSIIYIFSCIAYISSYIRFVLIRTKIGGKSISKHAMDLDIIRKTFAIAFHIIVKTFEFKKSNLTKEKIKHLLIEYYRSISTKDISFEESIQTNYSLLHSVFNSTIYQYIVDIHHMFHPKEKKASHDITFFLQKNKNQLMFIKDRKKTPIDMYHSVLYNIYDKARLPIPIKDIKMNVINDRKDYMMKCFVQMVYLYISKNLYMISPYTPKEDIPITIQNIQKEYDNLSNVIQEYERKKRDEEILHNLPAMFSLPSNNSRESDHILHACHTVYCMDGNRHRFEYISTSNASKKNSKEDIQKNRLFCTKCKLYLSDIEKENEKQIEEHNKIINDRISDINNSTIFFNLYFNACPKNTNHIFDEKTLRCRFCSVTKQELIDQHYPYFQKFKSTFISHFEKKQKKFEETVRDISAPTESLPMSKDKLKPMKIETIRQNIREIAQILSKKYKLEIYQLEYLGCFENVSYDLAPSLYVQGKLDEYMEQNAISRITTLLNHNTTFTIYHRILRNIHPFYRSEDKEIGVFFDKIKDKSFSFQKLPSLELHAIEYYQKYKKEKIEDTMLCNILLYILLKNSLDLLNKSMKTAYEKEIHEFIEILLKKYIYQDQIHSQYDIKHIQFKKSEKKEVLQEEVQVIEYEDEDVQEDNLFSYDYLDIDSDLIEDGYDIDVNIDD